MLKSSLPKLRELIMLAPTWLQLIWNIDSGVIEKASMSLHVLNQRAPGSTAQSTSDIKRNVKITIIVPTLLKDIEIFKSMLSSLYLNVLKLNSLLNTETTLVIFLNACNSDKLENLRNITSSYSDAFKKVLIKCVPTNLGYAPPIYLSYVETKNYTDIYVVLNDDVVIPENNVLTRLISNLINNKNIVALSPKIRNLSDPLRLDYAGAKGFYIDFLLVVFARGRLHDVILYDHGNDTDLSCDVFMPSGAFMVLRNIPEVIPDPTLIMTYEEADIGIKALCKGFSICFDNSVYVLHKGSTTIGSILSPSRLYYIYRNKLILILKYASISYVLLVMPLLFLHDIASAIYLTRYNRSIIISFIKAWLNMLKNIRRYYKLRYLYKKYSGCYDILLKQGRIVNVPVTIYYLLLRLSLMYKGSKNRRTRR